MTISSRVAAAIGASFLLFATPVFAQTTTPAPAAKSDTAAPAAAPAATDKKPAKAHSAESIECSKEADAKGLHGKERKKFRSECKKAAMEKKQ
jgi:psiF repeat